MALINGTSGADVLDGDPGSVAQDDQIFGLGGDDILNGLLSNDTLDGGDNNDTLSGGLGDDSLTGGAGADTFVVDSGGAVASTAQTDTITDFSALAGDLIDVSTIGISEFATIQQLLSSSGGNSFLTFMNNGFAQTVTITGLANALTLTAADFVFNTAIVDNTLNGTLNADDLFGGLGNDTLNGSDGNDRLFGEAGNDTLAGGNNNDTLFGGAGTDGLDGGNGNDSLNGGTGADTLTGGIGKDTLSYAGSALGVTVNLADNTVSGGDAQGDTISGFESIRGSSHGDTLTGDIGDNTIEGGNGIDTIEGGGGADILIGGNGTDTLSYAGSATGVTIDIAVNTATGGDATGDTISGFEKVTGSSSGDTLTGNNIVNTLDGGAGDDTIEGGAGADTLIGGIGTDTLSYAGSTALVGVTVNLATNTASGADATGDTISGFEAVIGSIRADFLTGSANADTLDGSNGNDTIEGGAGADTLIGGADFDTLSYAGSALGVTVSLTGNTASGGDAQGDVFSGFNGILGSSSADILTGFSNNNTLDGGAGDDTLDGGAGADALIGGNGTDTLSYAGSATGVTVNLASNSASGGDAAGDTITGFEAVIGSSSADILTGDITSNTLNGGNGADTIEGGAGADTLIGGADFDTLSYAGSAAGVTVNLADNTASGGDAAVDTISGFEAVTGSSSGDRLTGDINSNTLDGGDGNDTIKGGAGADVLIGGIGTDTLSYAGSAAGVTVNLATSFVSDGDAAGDVISGFEAVIGSGSADILTGDSAANRLTGSAGNDTLDGDVGADTMIGGTGNDNYFVDSVADVVTELVGQGIDTIRSAITYSLVDTDGAGANGGNVENLTLTGIAAINATGNARNNVLTGNSAANTLTGAGGSDTLDGGAGADTMIGGIGNDIYFVDAVTDVVTELAGQGTDTVRSSIDYALKANFETLILTGAAGISGTGTAAANTITGNSGNNIIRGAGGRDVLTGADGNDTFKYNAITDSGLTAGTRDVISDFVQSADRIDLLVIDANGALAGNAFTFIAAKDAAFTGVAGELRHITSGANTIVEGDTNGDAVADFQIQLTGAFTLTGADFIL